MKYYLLVCLVTLFGLLDHNAFGQVADKRTVVIPKIEGSIKLDGQIDEAAWEQAKKVQLIQNSPNYGSLPSEKTETYIGYTDDYIYAACKCYDRQSPSISTFKRDYTGSDTDWFELILDTFNDNENVIIFAVTPSGSRTDAAVYNDATGDSPLDAGWSTYWDVEVERNGEGFFVEMRVPISSLRFQKKNGAVSMGMTLMRIHARTNEFSTYPAIRPDWPLSILKASQAQDVVFENLQSKREFRLTPYLLSGVTKEQKLHSSGTSYQPVTDAVYDAGLDIKYGLSSNLTLDVTLNTDFAQVEADNQQVNVSRFPLFFPEKRTFFLERSSNFAFGFGGPNRLFYSRRIGLQNGEQVRILGGSRLVGRSGPWDIGVLSMQTARDSELGLASENFGVARFRRQMINPHSYGGGILATRLGMDGSYNIAYGLDGIFRVFGEDYFSFKWAQTFDHQASANYGILAPARVQLLWERRSLRGFNYALQFDRAGNLYNPAMGFEMREDYFHFGDRIAYGWVPEESSFLQRHSLSMGVNAYYRNSDHALETLEITPSWDFVSNTGHKLSIGGYFGVEKFSQSLTLSDEVTLAPGRYAYEHGVISYNMPGGWPLRLGVVSRIGELYSGTGFLLALSPTWNASRYLRLSGTYERLYLDYPGPGRIFESHIGRIRAEITPNVKYSLQSFVQYGSLSDNLAANIRFRYNPREGIDLYLVYNEAVNTNRFDYSPIRPLSQARTLLVKYTHALNFK